MALYKVDETTADLTLVAGLPSAGDVMDFKYMSVTYNDLTSASGWTAPYAGIMMANVPGNASHRIAQFKVNGTLVADNGTSENLYRGSTFAVPKGGVVTVHDASGTNNFYAVFAYVTGNAVVSQTITNLQNTLPYSFNKSSNIGAFNRQFVYQGHDLTWIATHTGRLTLRLLKNGDGYSLYFYNNTTNTLMDSYDNFFGTDSQSAGCTQASITLQGWVRKGDSIRLESNLPSSTALDHMFFCQTGLLAYNNDYD